MHDDSATHKEADFASDRPGRAFDIVGAGRHAMSQAESGQDHEMLLFARQVADYLNRSIANSDYLHLVLIAAPRFLGCLRSELSNAALKAVALEEAEHGELDEQYRSGYH
jgi:protein required for attachment to host cells